MGAAVRMDFLDWGQIAMTAKQSSLAMYYGGEKLIVLFAVLCATAEQTGTETQ